MMTVTGNCWKSWCRVFLKLGDLPSFPLRPRRRDQVRRTVLCQCQLYFLDGGYITIGAHTLVGPCVHIYTPHHPMNYLERRGSKEYAHPVTVGEDCWIGGGAIICPRCDDWATDV